MDKPEACPTYQWYDLRRPMTLSLFRTCAFVALSFVAGSLLTRQFTVHAQDSRVFELRTYHTFPGRLPALQARFRDHTTALFNKQNIGGDARNCRKERFELYGRNRIFGNQMTILQIMQWLEASPAASAMNGPEWAFPVVESLHFIGFAFLIGTIAIVDLDRKRV